jgi:hypothetical protein
VLLTGTVVRKVAGAADGPALLTTMLKLTFCPAATLLGTAVCVLERSAESITLTVVMLALLAVFESGVPLASVAVSEMTVPEAVVPGTSTVSVNVSDAPAPNVRFVQLIVPDAPTAGVVHAHPVGDVNERNTIPPGKASARTTSAAAMGPMTTKR